MNANELIERYEKGERDFSRAYLTRANLYGANLYGADLKGIVGFWNSHAVISHILGRAADTVDREMFAAWIGVKTDWCWKQFLALEDERIAWAQGVLREWIVEGDETVPACLKGES